MQLKIKYGRKLIFDSNTIEFFSPIKGANIRFNFDPSLPENVLALDITNPAEPEQLSIIEGQKIEVALNNNNLSRFIIVEKNNIPSINEIEYNSGIVFNSLRNENITADYINYCILHILRCTAHVTTY